MHVAARELLYCLAVVSVCHIIIATQFYNKAHSKYYNRKLHHQYKNSNLLGKCGYSLDGLGYVTGLCHWV